MNVAVGAGRTNAIRTGALNNNFYSAGTGTMYVCGNNGNTNNYPELFPLSFSDWTHRARRHRLIALGTTSGQCSPLNEIYNHHPRQRRH